MNKGFRSLPEHVQRKISPEMAKKYMAGGPVMQRPMFRQAGGPVAPSAAPMAPPPPAPAPMAPPSPSNFMQEATAKAQATGRQAGEIASAQMMANIEQADDPKSMIDAIRGNERPLEARYTELAQYVGEVDANKTPESVLAMVQPTIMMTEEGAIDSGIGELMQGLSNQIDMEMPSGEPTPMGQGVGQLMMQGAGNTPPRNFNRGGEVRHFAPGGEVASGAAAYMPEFQKLYSGVLGDQASRDAQLEERKKMTQAQMLFDIAQAALAAGAPTDRAMSPAERLMNAAQSTQLFEKIGSRAAGQLDAKQAMDAERRQMDLAALQSSIQASQSDVTAKQALERTIAGKSATKALQPDYKRVVSSNGVDLGTFNVNDQQQAANFEALVKRTPGATAYNLGSEPKSDKPDFKTVTLYPKDGVGEPITMPLTNKEDFAAIMQKTGAAGDYTESDTAYNQRIADETAKKAAERDVETKTLYDLANPLAAPQSFNINDPNQREEYNKLLNAGTHTADSQAYDLALSSKVEQTQYDRNRKDELYDIAEAIKADIQAEERALKRELSREERAKIELNRRLAMETNLEIEREQRALRRELNAEERKNAEARALIKVRADQELATQKEILTLTGNFTFREQNGQIVAIDNATGDVRPIFGTPEAPEPEYAQITLPNASGTPVTTIVDVNSPSGKQAIALVNQVSKDGGQASMQKISTASVTPRGFLIPEKGVFTSYDGGRTYVDENGVTQQVPGDAFEVSNTIAYDVAKNEKVRSNALTQLSEMDALIITGMTDEEGNSISATDMEDVKDAYDQARKGTGFWSKIYAAIDATAGGIVAPEYFAETFKDTQEARKFTKMVRVLGRSALAVSPRFAVADLQQVEQLFPTEEALFANPVTEANKLKTLATYLDQQKRIILENLAGDVPLDSTMKSQLSQKLFEINRLQEILGPVQSIGSEGSSAAAFDAAKSLIKKSVKKEQ